MTNLTYPLSPPHPLPYRQPSYSDAQRLVSPPLAASSAAAPETSNEIDDGGWGVDTDQTAHLAKMKKRMARRYLPDSIPYGMIHDYTSSWDQAAPSETPDPSESPIEQMPRVEIPIIEAKVEKEEENDVQAAETQIPSYAPALLDLSNLGDALRSCTGVSMDTDTLAQILRLVEERKKAHDVQPVSAPPLPPVVTVSTSTTSHPTPSRKAELPTPPNTDATGQPYPFGHVSAPHTRFGKELGSNHFPLAIANRWGSRTPSTSPPQTVPPARADSLTPTPVSTSIAQRPPSHPQLDTRLEAKQEVIAASSIESDGGWTPNCKVRDWAKKVTSESPPRQSPLSSQPSVGASTDGAGDTTNEAALSGLIISEADDSDSDSDLPTPGKSDSPTPGFPTKVELPSMPTLPSLPRLPTPPPPASSADRTDDRRTYNSGNGGYRQRHPPVIWEKSAVRWKRAPHPAFSPIFGKKRLTIRLPFPVHRDLVKEAMWKHFTRWGGVRMTWFQASRGAEVQNATLVFDTEACTEACLADPRVSNFLIRPKFHADPELVKIDVMRAPKHHTTSIVYIEITGKRHNSRSTSASPRRGDRTSSQSQASARGTEHKDPLDFHLQPLPASIFIDCIPKKKVYVDIVEDWARIRESHLRFANIAQRAYTETGRESSEICVFDLGRRVSDKDIILNLCDFFVEIVKASPAQNGKGWLIAVVAERETRALMDELAKVPGILFRWPRESDGSLILDEESCGGGEGSGQVDVRQDFEREPSDSKQESVLPPFAVPQPDPVPTPSLSVESVPGENIDIPTLSLEPSPASISTRSPTPPALPAPRAPPEHVPAQPSSSPPARTPTAVSSHSTMPTPISHPESMLDSRYPHLRKVLIPTYRGRTLREDLAEDRPRWFDDAAVFVGRLVKGQETEISLFNRFSQYGQMCGIEYHPNLAQTTYATARILYATAAAADRALHYAQGAVSFGSLLRVEKRRVLPNDVRMVEKYIDDFGRAYSPSMASQYSPPQYPLDDEMVLVQPLPLSSGPTATKALDRRQQSQSSNNASSLAPHQHELPHRFGSVRHTREVSERTHSGNGHSGLIPANYTANLEPSINQPSAVGSTPFPTPPITSHSTIFPHVILPAFSTLHAHAASTSINASGHGLLSAPVPDHVSVDATSITSRRRSPLLHVETKMEDGLFKVVYEESELKRFRREEGIPEPETETEPKVKEDMGQKGLRPIYTVQPNDTAKGSSLIPSIVDQVSSSVDAKPVIRSRQPTQQQRLMHLPVPFTPSADHQPSTQARPNPEVDVHHQRRPLHPRWTQCAERGMIRTSSIDYGDGSHQRGRAEQQGLAVQEVGRGRSIKVHPGPEVGYVGRQGVLGPDGRGRGYMDGGDGREVTGAGGMSDMRR